MVSERREVSPNFRGILVGIQEIIRQEYIAADREAKS
jgi:hypothetical protein